MQKIWVESMFSVLPFAICKSQHFLLVDTHASHKIQPGQHLQCCNKKALKGQFVQLTSLDLYIAQVLQNLSEKCKYGTETG